MKPTTVNTGTQKNCNHSFPVIRPQLFLVLLNLLINNIRMIKTVFDISACKNHFSWIEPPLPSKTVT